MYKHRGNTCKVTGVDPRDVGDTINISAASWNINAIKWRKLFLLQTTIDSLGNSFPEEFDFIAVLLFIENGLKWKYIF